MGNKANNEKKQPTLDNVTDIYKETVQTYINVAVAFKNIYTKYKEIFDVQPNIKKILDGGAGTLEGLRKLLNGLAVSHTVEADKEDKHTFVIKDKIYKFKTGNVDEENDEETKKYLELLLAYNNINYSILITLRNTLSVITTDIEKYLMTLDDKDENKEKYLELIKEEKNDIQELESIIPNESKEGETNDKK